MPPGLWDVGRDSAKMRDAAAAAVAGKVILPPSAAARANFCASAPSSRVCFAAHLPLNELIHRSKWAGAA